jgi:hypothetical protein
MKFLPKSHATVVAYLALLVALGGTAQAVAPLVAQLGKSNVEKSTTTLTNTGSGRALNLVAKSGSPLGLAAPVGTPAFSVSNTTQIPKLNASLLDGLNSSAFQAKLSGTCTYGIASVDAAGAATCAALPASAMVFSAAGGSSITIPEGVKSVIADLWGAGGGGDFFCASSYAGHIYGGGQGGRVEVAIPVTAGQTLAVNVGAPGYGGFNGFAGQGGGDTTVTLAGTLVATATGGAGGNDDVSGFTGGEGGTFSVASGLGLSGANGAASTSSAPGGPVGFAGSGGAAGGGSPCGGGPSVSGAVVLHFSTS